MKVAVIGLGSFGMSLARALARLGARVVAVDNEAAHVDRIKDEVHTALRLDALDRDALEEQGIHRVDCAIVCMGEDFAASELASVHLTDLGCPRVLARGTSEERVEILRALGPEVISPGVDAARNLAVTILGPGLAGHSALDDRHGVALAPVPPSAVGQALSTLDLEARHGVRVLALRRSSDGPDQILVGPSQSQVLREGDHLVLLGSDEDLVRAGGGLARS